MRFVQVAETLVRQLPTLDTETGNVFESLLWSATAAAYFSLVVEIVRAASHAYVEVDDAVAAAARAHAAHVSLVYMYVAWTCACVVAGAARFFCGQYVSLKAAASAFLLSYLLAHIPFTRSLSSAGILMHGTGILVGATAAAVRCVRRRFRTRVGDDAVPERCVLYCAVCFNVYAVACAFACGHVATCRECTALITECPLCRRRVSPRTTRQIFLSLEDPK
jgi:hypothetical protein